MLGQLFWTLLIVGFVSFGGGYSIAPVIEHELVATGWMDAKTFSDLFAVAGMFPGPIASNIAVMAGYRLTGVIGAVVAAVGILLPSFLIVVAVGLLLSRNRRPTWMEPVFYGLKPVVVALIFFAAFRFFVSDRALLRVDWPLAAFLAIFAVSLFLFARFPIHPLAVIALSGLAGVVIHA